MRLSSIVLEAWRNTFASAGRFFGLVTTLTVLLAALVIADERSIAGIIEAATRFQAAGGSTVILSATSSIDPRTCDRLATIPGVQASGAIRSTNNLRFDQLPSTSVPSFEISPGFEGLITGNDRPRTGILLSKEVAADLYVTPGASVSLERSLATVSDVYDYPTDGRKADLEYAILLPVATVSAFDACWVRAWPIPSNLSSLVRQALLPETPADTQVETAQLNSTLGSSFDGQKLFSDRISASAPLIALIVTAVLMFVSTRRRQVELASALHAGVSRSALLAQLLLESLIIAVIPLTIAVGCAAAAALGLNSPDADTVFVASLTIMMGGLGGLLLGTAAACLVTRESRLFVYFKNR